MLPKTYSLEVAGVKRDLPIITLNEKLAIASFVLLGDAELATKAAEELAKKLPQADALITAEAKGIPLVQEVAHVLGIPTFYVVRKSVKPYMENPLIDEVLSITTQKKQVLCLDGKDAEALRGKRVAIIDDVISTGKSLEAVERLISKVDAKVVARAAILAEGDAAKREDIIFLEELPLFML